MLVREHLSVKISPCQFVGGSRGHIWLLFNKMPLNGKQPLSLLAAHSPSEKIHNVERQPGEWAGR